MKIKSGLKFEKCDETDFRAFVNDEWEYTMKRNFGGDEEEANFVLRPPARAVGTIKKIRNHDSFRLSKYVPRTRSGKPGQSFGATHSDSGNRDAIKQFYAKTYSGIRELISQQRDRIQAETGKPFKASYSHA